MFTWKVSPCRVFHLLPSIRRFPVFRFYLHVHRSLRDRFNHATLVELTFQRFLVLIFFFAELQGHAIKNQDLLIASGTISLRGSEGLSAVDDDVEAAVSSISFHCEFILIVLLCSRLRSLSFDDIHFQCPFFCCVLNDLPILHRTDIHE